VSTGARATAAVRRRLAGRAGGRSGRGAILLYHRVAEVGTDPWRLAVAPERFAEQMAMLRSEFEPMPLAELVDAAQRRRLPPGAVAVTFDDGYRDNLTAALPVLERERVPATVFVATRYVGAGEPFWWDELTALLLRRMPLPDPLDVPLEDGMRRWPTKTRSQRRAAHDGLQFLLRHGDPERVEDVMTLLRAAAGLDGPADTRDASAMTIDELRALARSETIDIGAHTRTHTSVPALDTEIARDEVEGSAHDLELLLGRPPMSFSYPFGDHGPRGRKVVRKAGFEFAAGTSPGAVTWLTHPFELPRLWVEDAGPDWLRRRLTSVLSPAG
jgi:peptidoglycan/xylan/chitin deacetylase (PgdA/CDA1 family)